MPSPTHSDSYAASDDNDTLHLIVIGAGLAGLAAAISTMLECEHTPLRRRVTVLERTAALEEVGAGLQVTPNATRLLRHWGVLTGNDDVDNLRPAVPSYLAVRRYDGTRLLAYSENFQTDILKRYNGHPFWDIHRADLQRALVRRARSLGVDIRLGAEVVDVDFSSSSASVKLHDGSTVHGDVVLGADGLWSKSRELFLRHMSSQSVGKGDIEEEGRVIPTPKPTGDLAYRIILHQDTIQDPELRQFVAKPSVNFWVGPRAHVVGYSVRGGETYNLVLLCPDDLPPDVRRTAADVEQMKKLFESWDPLLSRLLACVDKVDKWRLNHISPLGTWTNETGTFLMAGDSCHPMLPYLAQGANSSLEDGAVLGRLLRYVDTRRGSDSALSSSSAITTPQSQAFGSGPSSREEHAHLRIRSRRQQQITAALALYSALRKRRGEAIANEALRQRDSFHMPDGPEQEARDAVFLACLGEEPSEAGIPFPSRWTCPTVQPWLYGYDAIAEADQAYHAEPFGICPHGGNDDHNAVFGLQRKLQEQNRRQLQRLANEVRTEQEAANTSENKAQRNGAGDRGGALDGVLGDTTNSRGGIMSWLMSGIFG